MTAIDLTKIDLKLHRLNSAEVKNALRTFDKALKVEWKNFAFVASRLPAAVAIGTVIAALAYGFAAAIMEQDAPLSILFCAAMAGGTYFILDLILLKPKEDALDEEDDWGWNDRTNGILMGSILLYVATAIGLAFGAFQMPMAYVIGACMGLLIVTFILAAATDLGFWADWLVVPWIDKLFHQKTAGTVPDAAPEMLVTCPRCQGDGHLYVWNKTGDDLHECVEKIPCMMCWTEGLVSPNDIEIWNANHADDDDSEAEHEPAF